MINYLYLYLIYLSFAIVPVLIWLFFYLKKDLHPEPKKMILKIFILGIIAAALAAVFEITVLELFPGRSLTFVILEAFLLIAFVEELVKYLVVKEFVFSSPELDEPIDVMLYMVISSLGFAMLENVLLFLPAEHPYAIMSVFEFALLRFLGAVFLHTLTSGTLGFFIAQSLCSPKHKMRIFISGFVIAVTLHGIYNIAILEFTGIWQYTVPAIIVVILACFTTYGFIKLRSLKSVCRI